MIENFTLPEELASNESFIAWYKGSKDLSSTGWEQWIALQDDRRQLVRQAVALLDGVIVNEKQIAEEDIAVAYRRMMARINDTGVRPVKRIISMQRFRWVAAASVVLLTIAAVLFKTYQPAKTSIDSAYGQILQRQLPDGTEVTINANSHLDYANLADENKDREVWLKGEAFFHVSKKPLGRRFVVHTDHFDIVVTGTQFNVLNRSGSSNVMLSEGSVNVESKSGDKIKMVPGDFVEFADNSVHLKTIKNDSLVAWKDKKLVFDNTPLSKVITIIHDNYGVDIKLSADAIGDKTISGMLPNDNLDILLQAINATNELEIVHKNGEIIIESRK